MSHVFTPGWDPLRHRVTRAAMLASRRYATVTAGQDYPKACSLSKFLLRKTRQGHAGSCWLHAGVCDAEVTANAQGYKIFPICRRLVGWMGKQLEGGGNPSDGGTCTDALLAMTEEKGAGIAHEDLCPYTDDYRTLGTKPEQKVFDDGKKSHLILPVDVRSDDDAKVLISKNYAVAIGTWWPYNFDDEHTFMDHIGQGSYGHALVKMGYVEPGVFPGEHGKYGWWQWQNWHGDLYPPLPPEYAKCVPGYHEEAEEKVSDFWVRYDQDDRLQKMGDYEYVSVTDVKGLDRNIVETDFMRIFPSGV